MDTDGLALSVSKKCREYVASHGWARDEKLNAVINFLKKIFMWRSTRWWHDLQTKMWKGIQEITKGGSISGYSTIVGLCWIKSPRDGLAKKNG